MTASHSSETNASETNASETNASETNASETNAARLRDINASIRYTMWSVFRVAPVLGGGLRNDYAHEFESFLDQLSEKDVVVRGTYDVAGLRADADLMIWWHAPTADALQDAYALLRRTRFGGHLTPV